ncbi:MAG: hypothetical protein LBH81_01380 [Rickettsiales bacterium]|jgi:hypothetical protein|nr:hypothetical protein [Rickettsiales bacterium]
MRIIIDKFQKILNAIAFSRGNRPRTKENRPPLACRAAAARWFSEVSFGDLIRKRNIAFVFFVFAFIAIQPSLSAELPRATPLFSTTSDWEALLGTRYSVYDIRFGRDKSMGDAGVEIYFLDGFPCIGEVAKTFTWVSPSSTFGWDDNAGISIGCVFRPQELKFAFRKIRARAPQGRATGYFVCNPEAGDGRTIQVRLETCEERPFK